MEVGDLVDDGLDNIGIIVKLGWYSQADQMVDWSHQPQEADKIKQRSYLVHFPDTIQNGWYNDDDLEVL